MKQYRYSELFRSIQGEGRYIGAPTLWLRFWGCNFTCTGFGQSNINDPSTWVDPLAALDPMSYKDMTDLPVIEYGCDSIYSWHKDFEHLSKKATASKICNVFEEHLPNGKFGTFHLAFTGGETVISQNAVVDIYGELERRGNLPKHITVETNGTQCLRDPIADVITKYDGEWFWSVSPKLSVSGESWEAAIIPEVVASYCHASAHGQLKFVVDGSQQCWDEVERAAAEYRKFGVDWDIYIMPCGATKESQEEVQASICEATISRGYHFSARLHNWIWGNKVGT